MERLELVLGDITEQAVDAIVNAANSALLGGGGVDGAIHRAAGAELLQATRKLGGCPVGEARITPGFALPARYVIHTVGPIWQGGDQGEAQYLASAYRSSFRLAAEHGVETIAFPSIGTGAYRYPVEDAARIALTEIKHMLTHYPAMTARMVLFSPEVYRVYEGAQHEVVLEI